MWEPGGDLKNGKPSNWRCSEDVNKCVETNSSGNGLGKTGVRLEWHLVKPLQTIRFSARTSFTANRDRVSRERLSVTVNRVSVSFKSAVKSTFKCVWHAT